MVEWVEKGRKTEELNNSLRKKFKITSSCELEQSIYPAHDRNPQIRNKEMRKVFIKMCVL